MRKSLLGKSVPIDSHCCKIHGDFICNSLLISIRCHLKNIIIGLFHSWSIYLLFACFHCCTQGLCFICFLTFEVSLQQPNTLQNSILASSIPHLRDFDLPLSPLLTTQAMPTRYSTTVSSISGPTISTPEVFISTLNFWSIYLLFACSCLDFGL